MRTTYLTKRNNLMKDGSRNFELDDSMFSMGRRKAAPSYDLTPTQSSMFADRVAHMQSNCLAEQVAKF